MATPKSFTPVPPQPSQLPPLEQHLNHLADTLKLLLSRPTPARPRQQQL